MGRKEGMVGPPSSVSALPASTPKFPEPALDRVLIEIPETSSTSQSILWYLLRLNFLQLRFGIGVVVPALRQQGEKVEKRETVASQAG